MSRTTLRRVSIAAGALLAIVALAAGCGGGSGDGGEDGSDSASGGGTIAFLLPEKQAVRYEAHDRPVFEEKVKELCDECKILYSNATGDIEKQEDQAEAALAKGVDLLVIDPVDPHLASAMVPKAVTKHVPVLSYDRLIENSKVDYYVAISEEEAGFLMS